MGSDGATLHTQRLLLRPVKATDVEDIYRNIADWDVIRMLAMPPWPYTRADAETFVATARALMIVFDGEVIGGIGIGRRRPGDFIGYWLGKRFWLRGFAHEAAHAMIARHFDGGKTTITSGYVADNDASAALQRKLGFRETGRGLLHIRSRDCEVEEIETVLTRDDFETATRAQAPRRTT